MVQVKRHFFRVLVLVICVVCVSGCVKREKTAVESAQIPAAAVMEDTVVETVEATAGAAADLMKNTETQTVNSTVEPAAADIRAFSKEGDDLARQTNEKAVELQEKVERQAAALKEQTENNEKVNALKAKAQSAFDEMENAFDDF
jgi:hypothetical protein